MPPIFPRFGKLAAGLLAAGAAAAGGQEPFSLVILPDTQHYVAWECPPSYRRFWEEQVAWIVSNRERCNIRFVLHEGDITQNSRTGTNRQEWSEAARIMRPVFDHGISCAMACGNHDDSRNPDYSRNTELFNEYFPLRLFQNQKEYIEAFEPGRSDNLCFRFAAGGENWLLFALEYGPRDEVLAWVKRVARSHPDDRAILLTHAHTYSDDTLHGMRAEHLDNPNQVPGQANDGVAVWDKLVSQCPNMAFVFSGHVLGDGAGLCAMTGRYGNVVHQMAANYQMLEEGGGGFMRLLTFDPDRASLRVETFSPAQGTRREGSEDQFTLSNLPCFLRVPPPSPMRPRVAETGERTGLVTWDALPDGAASRYIVYRNGQEAAVVDRAQWRADGLAPQSTCRVAVAAVNRMGMRSARSLECALETQPDTTPPRAVGLRTPRDTRIEVLFDEDLESLAAANVHHYNLAPDGEIRAAAMPSNDMRHVFLDTACLSSNMPYRLTARNLADRGGRNAMTEPQTIAFEYRPALLHDPFEGALDPKWAVLDEGRVEAPSDWKALNGQLRQCSSIHGPAWGAVHGRQGTLAYWSDPAALGWSNYICRATFITPYDGCGVGLIYHFRDARNYYRLETDRLFRFTKLLKLEEGRETLLARHWEGFVTETLTTLEVEIRGTATLCRLNGRDVFGGAVPDAAGAGGTVGLFTWDGPAFFEDIVVEPLPQEIAP